MNDATITHAHGGVVLTHKTCSAWGLTLVDAQERLEALHRARAPKAQRPNPILPVETAEEPGDEL